MNTKKRNPSSIESFEYMNSFGAVFKDSFVIHKFKSTIPIAVRDMKEVKIHKERVTRWNFVFGLATALSVFAFFIFETMVYLNYFVLATAVLFFAMVFIVKIYTYKMLLLLNNTFFEVKIPNNLKDEAKVIMIKINSKIEENARQSIY